MICQDRRKLKKFGWWWLNSKSSYLHKTTECWKIIQCYLVTSITTYQVKYPKSKITTFLQISILTLSSVTWSQNVQLSPTNLKCAPSSWSDIAGLENCNFIYWNIVFQQKTVIFTNLLQNVDFVYFAIWRENRVYINQKIFPICFTKLQLFSWPYWLYSHFQNDVTRPFLSGKILKFKIRAIHEVNYIIFLFHKNRVKHYVDWY